jgi:hypothetical protein
MELIPGSLADTFSQDHGETALGKNCSVVSGAELLADC